MKAGIPIAVERFSMDLVNAVPRRQGSLLKDKGASLCGVDRRCCDATGGLQLSDTGHAPLLCPVHVLHIQSPRDINLIDD
jgi:hypothetical protein